MVRGVFMTDHKTPGIFLLKTDFVVLTIGIKSAVRLFTKYRNYFIASFFEAVQSPGFLRGIIDLGHSDPLRSARKDADISAMCTSGMIGYFALAAVMATFPAYE